MSRPTAADLTNARLEALIDRFPGPGGVRRASAKKLRAFMLGSGQAYTPDARGVGEALDALGERRAASLPDFTGAPRSVPGTVLRTAPDGRRTWTLTLRHAVHPEHGVYLLHHLALGSAAASALDAFTHAPSRDRYETALARVGAEAERARAQAAAAIAAWRSGFDGAGAEGDDLAMLAQKVRDHLSGKAVDDTRAGTPGPAAILADALGKATRHLSHEMAHRRIRAVVGYADHVERLKGSRLPRRIVFHVGPTNSGKTYDAMKALAAAADGVYLAPLRLLALEGYERLREEGVAAGMLTGEEAIDAEGATHLSMTIEMASLEREVEVGVIDEVQMLLDPDRGWAWTRALFGLRCRTLHLCGSEDAARLVERAGAILGEPVELVRHERKSPLRLLPRRVGLDDVEPGDAVVAFSRKEVLLIRENLIRRGHRVACVYGALSPEVRRGEASRYRTGLADVLVATDAIGMGLNLGPLRRVILTTVRKFDGTRLRNLRLSEIRQIAGRAGRYGHHDEGLVAVMDGDGHRVRRALDGHPDPREPDELFYVRPEPATLDEAAAETGARSLAEVLRAFAERTVYQGSPYKPSALDESIKAAGALGNPELPPSEAFAFTNCPIDRRHPPAVAWLARQAAIRALGARAALPRVGSPEIGAGAGGLAGDEAEARTMTAYLWLARRFPDTFPFVPEATARRNAANARVEAELAREAYERAGGPDPSPRRASREPGPAPAPGRA